MADMINDRIEELRRKAAEVERDEHKRESEAIYKAFRHAVIDGDKVKQLLKECVKLLEILSGSPDALTWKVDHACAECMGTDPVADLNFLCAKHKLPKLVRELQSAGYMKP